MTTHDHDRHDTRSDHPAPADRAGAPDRAALDQAPLAERPPDESAGGARWVSTAVWLAGGCVAGGAAIATAHGLYEVAAGAGVPAGIAWLYPLITDGLALVAYAATTRLHGPAARYAWTVVVLAAGLSGLAQASYLAADHAPGAAGSGALLRFGVGAWPAVAAAVVAHLLYLLAAGPRAPDPTAPPTPTPPGPRRERVDPSMSTPPPVQDALPGPAGRAGGDRSARLVPVPAAIDQPGRPAPMTERSAQTPTRPSDRPSTGTPGAAPDGESESPRDRAASAASRHRAATGAWPAVRALALAADVSYGTAQTALAQLRDQPRTSTTKDEITS